ncbi:hypothetical protein CRI70_25665, partial [Streptomyces sp. Ru87]
MDRTRQARSAERDPALPGPGISAGPSAGTVTGEGSARASTAGLSPGGPSAAGLPTAGLRAAGLTAAGLPTEGARSGTGSTAGPVTGHTGEAGPDGARPWPGVPRQGVPAAESFPAGRPHPEPGPYDGPGPAAPRRMPRRHSVRAQILDALRTALADGELAPGEVYSAPALAERFGVSPTPVREAMQQLASEGAVETVPNRGFRVARRSARDLAELAEVRALLEIPVLLRLAQGGQPEQWDELRPYAAATVAAAARGDRAGYAEADRAFHQALLTLSGNRQLALVGDALHRRMQGPCGG